MTPTADTSATRAPAPIDLHRGYLPGCIGRIAQLHADYYHRLVGFGVHFEAKVARELANFCERYDATRDALWLARDGTGIQGSIAIDGRDAASAHLRWFIASDAVRGTGIGSRLLANALEFCDTHAYRQVHLWTFAGLDPARHLYEKHGFRLVHQQPGASWGTPVDEQRFERRR